MRSQFLGVSELSLRLRMSIPSSGENGQRMSGDLLFYSFTRFTFTRFGLARKWSKDKPLGYVGLSMESPHAVFRELRSPHRRNPSSCVEISKHLFRLDCNCWVFMLHGM